MFLHGAVCGVRCAVCCVLCAVCCVLCAVCSHGVKRLFNSGQEILPTTPLHVDGASSQDVVRGGLRMQE